MLGIVLYVTAGERKDAAWFSSFVIIEHGGCRGKERQEGLRRLLEAARAGQQNARRVARLIVETGDVDFALAAGGREAFQEIMWRRIIDAALRKFAAGELCRKEGSPRHWNDCYNRMVEMNWFRLQTHLVPAHLAPNPRKAAELAGDQEKRVRQDVENGEASNSDAQYVKKMREKFEKAVVLYDRAKAGDRNAQYELGWNLSADPDQAMCPARTAAIRAPRRTFARDAILLTRACAGC
ncbi:MAG: hypothetical protein LBU11_00865 [Zoogloeaceae bacterium]|jgi:hypothetical protein|nr:hypothetical protein [Zoogloeaceae bacterium]